MGGSCGCFLSSTPKTTEKFIKHRIWLFFFISARLMINDCVNAVARFCFLNKPTHPCARICSKRSLFLNVLVHFKMNARKQKKKMLYVIFRIARTYTRVSERFNLYEWMIIYFNYASRSKRMSARFRVRRLMPATDWLTQPGETRKKKSLLIKVEKFSIGNESKSVVQQQLFRFKFALTGAIDNCCWNWSINLRSGYSILLACFCNITKKYHVSITLRMMHRALHQPACESKRSEKKRRREYAWKLKLARMCFFFALEN